MHSVYQRQAERFDKNRNDQLFEKPWLDRFLKRIPENGTILDVGCGTGKPIADYLISQGQTVTGYDFSSAMLSFARRRHPAMTWLEGDMRRLDLDQQFDGVIAWNSFFHLTPGEQVSTLPLLLKHVKDGGPFLTTIGNQHGETEGYVGGEAVYHGSLAKSEYEQILSENGFSQFQIVLDDPDTNLHCVLLALKTGERQS